MKQSKALKSLHLEKRTVRWALCALFCTIVAEGLLTQFLVTGGYGLEINPLLANLIGERSFLAIKIAGGFLVTLLLWVKYSAEPRPVYRITAAALTFYTAILYWNLFGCVLVLASQPI